MSLRDDMAALARHIANGTGKEWFNGSAPILDIDGHEILAKPKGTDECKEV